MDRAVLFSRPAIAPSVNAWISRGKVLEIAHTDDIVTGLVNNMNPEMLRSFRDATVGWLRGEKWDYLPHRYNPDARTAAAFLSRGSLLMTEPMRHHSSTHRH